MRFSKGINYYLAINVLKMTLLVWAVLVGFDVITAFYNNMSGVGQHGFTTTNAVLITLFTIPRRAHNLLPVASVIGLLMGLGQMAVKSELIAMRALGLSKLQLGFGAILPCIGLAMMMMLILETAGTAGDKQVLLINTARANPLSLANHSGVWARDGEWYFNAKAGSAQEKGQERWLQLADVRLYHFAPSGKLLSITQAQKAQNHDQQWILHDVQETFFDPNAVRIVHAVQAPWQTQITNKSLEATLSNPNYLSIPELRTNIEYLKRNQLDAQVFETAYWGRWFYPIKIFILGLSVLPFAFGSLRSGGLGKSVFIGILIGVSAVMLENLFVSLSDVYRFDVRVAYLLAPISVFALCWGFLAKRI